ncbi:MAG: hypothetical protein Q7R90_00815 [bacterium]|nr:hypothetical protein [bacterium]
MSKSWIKSIVRAAVIAVILAAPSMLPFAYDNPPQDKPPIFVWLELTLLYASVIFVPIIVFFNPASFKTKLIILGIVAFLFLVVAVLGNTLLQPITITRL